MLNPWPSGQIWPVVLCNLSRRAPWTPQAMTLCARLLMQNSEGFDPGACGPGGASTDSPEAGPGQAGAAWKPDRSKVGMAPLHPASMHQDWAHSTPSVDYRRPLFKKTSLNMVLGLWFGFPLIHTQFHLSLFWESRVLLVRSYWGYCDCWAQNK